MRWTRTTLLTRACACGRRSRVVLMPRRWHQAPEKQAFRGRRWQTSPVTGESAKETVKTIARGMPDVSGVTVVTNACAFYHCTRGCGRAERPAFPAPSDSRGRNEPAKPRKQAARSRTCILPSLRGAKRRSNPFLPCSLLHGLLRGACHRAALCADPLARNDGVDGPRRHQCARLVMSIRPDEGAVHERD
jgi:hypothetical protein